MERNDGLDSVDKLHEASGGQNVCVLEGDSDKTLCTYWVSIVLM